MDPSIPNTPNRLRKAVWENLFQFLAASFLLVVLIINWNRTDVNLKVGVLFIVLVYLMFRITFIMQAQKFARKIEEERKSQTEVNTEAQDIYEKSLRK